MSSSGYRILVRSARLRPVHATKSKRISYPAFTYGGFSLSMNLKKRPGFRRDSSSRQQLLCLHHCPPLALSPSLCLSSSLLFFRCRFFIPASALGALKDRTVALLSVFGPSPWGYMIRLDLSSTHKEDCRFDVSSCCAEGCVIVIEWRAIFYVTLVDVRDPALGTGPAAEDRRSTASGAYGSPHVTVPSHETLSSSIIFSLR
ncbi:hypothetical protein OPV22_023214 [Ensete ventricosum]|uniref:MATH domain-containing protein n=1 Tax=Ensete ventricosum TaxID=4639 RepID=A0AAV8QLA1_ENSVE|nr:hypothetical protein OPV22_023214 [Ensete ventricosum]